MFSIFTVVLGTRCFALVFGKGAVEPLLAAVLVLNKLLFDAPLLKQPQSRVLLNDEDLELEPELELAWLGVKQDNLMPTGARCSSPGGARTGVIGEEQSRNAAFSLDNSEIC